MRPRSWHFLTGEYPPQPGGVSDYCSQIAHAIAAEGDEVHVWTPPAAASPAPPPGPVQVHRLRSRFGVGSLRDLSRRLDRLPPPRRLLIQYVADAFGVGMGFANTALIIAVQTSVAWHERGVATASTMFFRTIGGALAVGVMGGVINAAVARDPSIPPEATSQVLTKEGLSHMDPALLSRLGGLLAGALDTVFWIIAAMAVIAFVVSLWFPKAVTEGGRDIAVPVPERGGDA